MVILKDIFSLNHLDLKTTWIKRRLDLGIFLARHKKLLGYSMLLNPIQEQNRSVLHFYKDLKKSCGVRFIKRRFINCVSTKLIQIVADLGKAVFTVEDLEA